MAFLCGHFAIVLQIIDRAMTPDEFRAVVLSFPRAKETTTSSQILPTTGPRPKTTFSANTASATGLPHR